MANRKREATVNFSPGPAALPDEVCACGVTLAGRVRERERE